ncbi:MAG TPA: phosphomannomutase/phosphoglucomutase [Sedimenticola thiotaurini]|uniref:phosphomannomutase n=1 Tax=Sedimenticola thiotaurini TaxID=1543721 RepID=A0A831RPN7_9GAMM|nr:phosphomannomutase/phosphoglucomutase [Sedimenticola thiotaurini]
MSEKTKKGKKGAGKARGSRVSRALIALMLAIAGVLALAAVALFLLDRQQQEEAGTGRAEAAAAGLAGRLAAEMRLRTTILERFVRDMDLGTLLQQEKGDVLKRRERQFKRLMPDVLRLRVLPKEWDEMDTRADPPFGFAALEVLRTVERSGRPAPAEVQHPGKPYQHLVLAVPVPDRKGKLVGVAHLALRFELLRQALAENAGGVPLQVRQQVPGREAVALTGNPVQDAAPAGSVAVAGTLLQVAYWPAAGAVSGLPGVVTVLGVALVPIALLLLLFRLWLGRLLAAEQQVVLSHVRGMMKSEAHGFGADGISELGLLMQGLMKLRRGPAGVVVPLSGESAAEAAAVETRAAGPESAARPAAAMADAGQPIPAEIFRAYDIRGVVGEQLTEGRVERIGRAIGSQAREQGEQSVIVGRDGRNSSESLADALCRGLQASGCDVIDLGMVPTPLLYFATHVLGSRSGVMVTGSHNPPEYNGLKVLIAGESLSGEAIQALRLRAESGNLAQGEGRRQEQDLVADYLNRITEDVQLLAPLNLVVDCGNGSGGLVAPLLFRALGCNVTELYCEVNGNFPAHHPDPSDPDNLAALIAKVKETGADLGIALDGDADRIGVVDGEGRIIWPDRLLMLLARDVLTRNPGADVIYDVKSSRHLAGEILACGGRPIMWKSGHSLMEAKLRETGAVLAGEFSGHIFFGERWYGFDDGVYSSARLLEVLSAEGLSPAEVFAQLPESVATPELVLPVAEGTAGRLMQQLQEQAGFPGAKLVTVDGIRAEFGDGWGLVRASNTAPALVFRFEADDEAVLARIQGLFREQLAAVDPTLTPPF